MLESEKNPNPTKDQHFMVDKNMITRICDTATIQKGESIIEIGGGEGALTDYLLESECFLTVVEKDPYYANFLKEKYRGVDRVTIIEGDALELDFSSYDRIVANLPYTITEPFLMNLAYTGALDYNPDDPKGSILKKITLVISQNSLRKMVAPVQIVEGKSKHLNQEFGFISAICKTFCDVEIVSAIPSESFFPEPAVTSFLINLVPKKEKTTVDRIMTKFFVDKKGVRPSIKKLYLMMLNSGEIYKANKHKGTYDSGIGSGFTSPAIQTQNIYDLKGGQISQLVADLIRNDLNIKSRRSGGNSKLQRDKMDFGTIQYLIENQMLDTENFSDNDDEDDEEQMLGVKEKFEKKYDYMFDIKRYDVLMHRGLERISDEELQQLLNGESDNFNL